MLNMLLHTKFRWGGIMATQGKTANLVLMFTKTVKSQIIQKPLQE